jgi:hypothetical protein
MIKDVPIYVPIFVAVLAALASLAVALINYFGSRRTQREVESLRAELAERKSERDARRDYEYEARKRLYHECEPLLFQLYEASENALYRIHSLARTARKGNLDPADSWLGGPDYYMTSTIYNLLAPVAVFKLIHRRLTFVDLTLEPHIKAEYILAKSIYVSFTDDFGFAAQDPPITYDPNNPAGHELRENDPVRYSRQGLAVGRLDFAAEGLLPPEPSGPSRLKSFGEFEAEYYSEDSANQERFSRITDVFTGFHPKTRPVLWRILIAQAHIYRTLLNANRGGPAEVTVRPVQPIPKDERMNLFEWRRTAAEATDEHVLVEPFSVGEKYLHSYLRYFGV